MNVLELELTKQVESNDRGRDFVIGDLHGCYSALLQAMAKVNFDFERDRIFALGDLVDRGPECFDCLRLLDAPWFYSVLGNHEYLMMSALRAGVGSYEWENWMHNGGHWFTTLNKEQYEQCKSLLVELSRLPVTMTLRLKGGGRVGLSHAQPPDLDWQSFCLNPMPDPKQIHRALWSRDIVLSKKSQRVLGVDATFHGHTVVPAPTTFGNMHFLDTAIYLSRTAELVELTEALVSGKSEAA